MKDWFTLFHESLHEGKGPEGLDLIPAGTATAEAAFGHYRFQNHAKSREAVEASFPTLVEKMGKAWGEEWKLFWASKPHSPRSMDRFSEVFLNFFLERGHSEEWNELIRFEHLLDTYAWTHSSLQVKALAPMDGASRLVLAAYEIHYFKTPVLALYEAREAVPGDQAILVLLRGDNLYYRGIEAWQEQLLQDVTKGVGAALENVDENASDQVAEFFQWLGGSGLILSVS